MLGLQSKSTGCWASPLDSDSHGWGLAPHPLNFLALPQQLNSGISWVALKGHGGSPHLRGSPGFSTKSCNQGSCMDLINWPSCLWHLWSVVRSDKSPGFFKVQKAQFQQWNIFTGRETRKRMQLPCFWNLWFFSTLYVTVPSASMLSPIATFCSRWFCARDLLGI